MNNNLDIRDQKMIYSGDIPLIPDVFDEVFKVEGYLVAYNSSKLVIINPEGQVIVSEEGTVMQIYSWGKCISLKKGNVSGVYYYDGTLLVPFEYYLVFIAIVEANQFVFEIQDTPQSGWRPYSLTNH